MPSLKSDKHSYNFNPSVLCDLFNHYGSILNLNGFNEGLMSI